MSRIVIADDSSVARMVIIKSLEMLGVDSTKIIEVSNGQEALRVVKHNNVG